MKKHGQSVPTRPVLQHVLVCDKAHDRAVLWLQVMQRLKIAKNLNIRQAMLVENAYYTSRPPERLAVEKKERTPLQQYIKHLVHDRLTEDEPKQVMRMFSRVCNLCGMQIFPEGMEYLKALAATLLTFHSVVCCSMLHQSVYLVQLLQCILLFPLLPVSFRTQLVKFQVESACKSYEHALL